MAGRSSSVDYNPVPSVEAQGGGGTPMGVRSTPADMGAQVGEAATGLGDAAFQAAQKQQGIYNETAMTNADSALAVKVGQIKGAYLNNTGQAAVDAYPKYQADLEAARQETRATLPAGAQHGFDMLATRTIAAHIADGSTYAATQNRAALIDAGTNLSNVNVQAVLDPSVASDPARVQWHQDSAIHGIQMGMDENHSGLKTDSDTGTVSFDESKPEGKQLKAQYQNRVNDIITQVQTNRFDTLAKGDVLGAFNIYQQDRAGFPRPTQVALDASFAPKVFNAHVQNGSSSVIQDAEQDHANLLYNPDSSKGAIDTVLKNEGGLSKDGHAIYGIDRVAHPEEFAEASKLSPADGEAYARNFYKQEYWDKKGIGDLPPETQKIVMDGVVNHYPEFGDKLIQDAKDGATPQQLIQERRDEYQRLATTNPDKYGANLAGWNNRLDNLQSGMAMEGTPKSYATNPDGSKLTTADYYRTHSEDVLQKADAQSEKDMPGDLAYKRAMRETVSNYMAKTISNQQAQYTLDNRNVVEAINGKLTKGQVPETEADLRAIPGMSGLLDKVAAQDPKFAEGIPTMIAKTASRNTVSNSSNGYDTVMRTLEPADEDHPNRIMHQGQIDSLLGKSDGTGINKKDYNDAKQALEIPQPIKDSMSKHMKDITNANGNVDGLGQQRAMQWYSQAMGIYNANEAKGDKKLPPDQLTAQLESMKPQLMPSRMQQISNSVKSNSTAQPSVPTATGANGEKYALQGGQWVKQ